MECKLIGVEIVSKKNLEGIIVDKALGYCNGASVTIYICMKKDGSVFEVSYDGIKEIKEFAVSPNSDFAIYLKQYKKS